MHELMAISNGVVVDLTVLNGQRSAGRTTDLGVELRVADLEDADSEDADSEDADSEDADLEDADLEDADLDVAPTSPGVTVDLSLVDAGTNGLPPELAWQERALCAQTDPEAFFPEKGGSTREAKRVCMACEVRAECLEYALAKDERFGIWGGLSERERRRVKKRAV